MRNLTRCAAAFLFPLLLSACIGFGESRTAPVPDPWKRPAFRVRPSGENSAYKRYERYPEHDYWWHFSRRAYIGPMNGIPENPSDDQKNLIETLGLPEYVRKPFLSYEEDRVEEWVYFERREIYQFIGGRTVFEGPLTDYEQILITHGYPDHQYRIESNSMASTTRLVYRGLWNVQRVDMFILTNDTLLNGVEGD